MQQLCGRQEFKDNHANSANMNLISLQDASEGLLYDDITGITVLSIELQPKQIYSNVTQKGTI